MESLDSSEDPLRFPGDFTLTAVLQPLYALIRMMALRRLSASVSEFGADPYKADTNLTGWYATGTFLSKG